MDERNRAIFLFFVLFVVLGKPAANQPLLDVCATCHTDATCEEKTDGSGKVCNCKYGFVGNGRTFCQDKDECQIGSSKICGQHTTCHNTYGSYYCTCLAGYSPSNNLDVFIPNDGTHCQDIDECRVAGQCGEGGECRNLDGSFDCSCQEGYRVHNGAQPFHPPTDHALCKVVDCGAPAAVEDTVQVSLTGTTYGSVATFVCDEGFVWRRGHNSSVCAANGLWRGLTLVCEEVSCGDPPLLESTEQVWNNKSTFGSTVHYICKEGFHKKGGHNVSACNENGEWTPTTLSCQEINCWEPPLKRHAHAQWDGISHVGSVVQYQCEEGYYTRGLTNHALCEENGLWEDIDLWCEEIRCGPPLYLPNTNLLWDRRSTRGSVALYECMDGFYQESGNNFSTCSLSGEWGEVSLKCKAKCGPIPFLANSEVVWHNRSVVIHRCMAGYHSWRGSNASLCNSSGVWETATLRCVEIKPPINHLLIHYERCLHWKAEKYEEDTEDYKVTYSGSRDYQTLFRDKGKRFLSSKADQLTLCLKLLPVTNYSITITALSAKFSATITTNTSLPVPPAPVVYYMEVETPAPTLQLQRSPNTLDPLSLYQVFVLPVEGIMMFDCSSPRSLDPSVKIKSSEEYITAQLSVRNIGTHINFTVGDGFFYGGFHNALLESGKNYYIILRAVSQWKTDSKSSCVLWAKVTGTPYVLSISLVSAALLVAVVILAAVGGYSVIWCIKKIR
ncbi:sushi domain-containing protein 1 isoform X2 [Cololabis saira]|uniref:sushi domain-containing protein 1 isoform X2 n=1 Tax=Cololabis saira TaxID=129043 RepID=UPI002AD48CC3|nr:sushi domain-containing protein 1 isoform X2 [Cololabis saira]